MLSPDPLVKAAVKRIFDISWQFIFPLINSKVSYLNIEHINLTKFTLS